MCECVCVCHRMSEVFVCGRGRHIVKQNLCVCVRRCVCVFVGVFVCDIL